MRPVAAFRVDSGVLSSPSDPPAASTASRVRHLAANFLLALLFALLAYRGFIDWQATGRPHTLIFAAHEAVLVALIITRRQPTEESRSPRDWLIAVIGSAAPLLQRPTALLADLAFLSPIALALQIAGASLTILAALSLGRSYGVVPANRGVKSGGLYRFVRHPIYGSYFVGYLGFFLANISWQNASMLAVTLVFQVGRALAEERVLMNDPAYQEYAGRVRRRFIPFVV